MLTATQAKFFALIAFGFVLCAIGVAQQVATNNTKDNGEYVVGISLDSNYAHISNFLPRLRTDLAKTLPNRRKRVRVVEIPTSQQDAKDAAKAKNCQYLLQMTISEIRGVAAGVQFGTPQPADEHRDDARERQELDWVRIDYRLSSLNDDSVDASDMDHVRYGEIPTSWDALAFETTVSRSVTRVAVASLGKLPKK
jgi:hypothetical protein